MVRHGEDPLDLDTRRRIYGYVEEHPGSHMREIGRETDIPMGTLEYNLRTLVDEDLLTVREDGRYSRYFVTEQTSRQEKDVLSTLRQETSRRIVTKLLLEPGLSHGEIHEAFDVSASTLSFHLKRLVDADVLEKEKDGRRNLYSVADPDIAGRALVRFSDSFKDDVVNRFAEVWLGLGAGLEPEDEE